jgi:NADH-quinone oxidoreductase subunit J
VTGTGTAAQVAFWCLTALAVGGALFTILQRNLVSAVMSLVASFFGLAGLYAMLSAHFLAAIQILVYAGAIMTLFVFVVMVLNREEAEPWALRGLFTKAIGIGSLGYLMVRLGGYLFSSVAAQPEAPPPAWGGVADVGNALFTTYLFPFEAVSIALLVAIIGAVVVARTPRKTVEEGGHATDHAGGLAHHVPSHAAPSATHEATASARDVAPSGKSHP